MAEMLSNASFISYIAAIIFLVSAVIVWFVFKIPMVIGDLSGRNARKSIEQLRKNNEKNGNKPYRSSAVNAARGKITETIKGAECAEADANYETGILSGNHADTYDQGTTGSLLEENETQPLERSSRIAFTKRSGEIEIKLIEEIIMVHTEEIIK